MKGVKKHLGYIDDMSDEQRKMVEGIKKDLSAELAEFPEINTTWNILRFLRARDFNYDRAKYMLAQFLHFRKKKDFRRIAGISQTNDRAQLLRQNYTSGHYGTDYQGRIIIIEKVTGYQPDTLFKFFTIEDIEDYLIQMHERLLFIELPISSMLHKKRIDNTFLIVDLKNVNVTQLFKSKLKAFVKFGTQIAQDYYPELLCKSVFINSPLIFKAIWAIISLWMDKKTVSKFDFESGAGLKRLSQYLDVDQLPAEIGGKNQTALIEGYGPWKEALKESYQNHSFFLKDREPEYLYYYTEEERSRVQQKKQNVAQSLNDLTKSHNTFENSNSFFVSTPVINDLKISQFKVSLNRSAIN